MLNVMVMEVIAVGVIVIETVMAIHVTTAMITMVIILIVTESWYYT